MRKAELIAQLALVPDDAEIVVAIGPGDGALIPLEVRDEVYWILGINKEQALASLPRKQ